MDKNRKAFGMHALLTFPALCVMMLANEYKKR